MTYTGIIAGMGILAVIILVIIVAAAVSQSKKNVKTNERQSEMSAGRHPDSDAVKEKAQKDRLLQTEKKLWDMEQAKPYDKLFEREVMPMQMLMGLARYSADEMEKERLDYYVWDMIADPMTEEIRRANGKIEQGRIVLPEQNAPFDENSVLENMEKMTFLELERYIRENELRLQAGEIAFREADTVRQLGDVVNAVEDLKKNHRIDWEEICRLAQKVQFILEKNQIYPMFAEDSRLTPDLKKRFSKPKKYSIRYPGLFIKREDRWEVLGAHIGMDDCEV